jgi:hypothetical protein
MKLMSKTLLAFVCAATIGCGQTMRDNPPAPAPDNTPVGTTGTTSSNYPNEPQQVSGTRADVIPVGQELDVRLQTALSSATATAEQRFEATTAVDLMQGNEVLIPAGSTVRGVVRSADAAGKVDRVGRLSLAFDQIVIRGREYPVRAMATQVFESGGIREEAKTVGTAGAVGAIVGGILGGLKGALIGAVVGSGGVIAATDGKDVDLPAGTIVRMRLDQAIDLR